LKIIHQNSVYVNHLIDDLFLFAKLDMQKLEFQFQCVPFKNFMDDLMEEYQLDFTEQAISFGYDNVITGEEQVKLDGKRFHQAINNILSNAVQHNANRQLAIRVRVYRQAEGVGIDISDNGPGIAPDKVPFIFDRFYRVHTERPKEMTGSGLGLAIARELIEAHGGHIRVVSTLGKGTCFTIELPVWPDSEGETLCSVC
jgi:signal transduction histidine kinase